MLTTLPIVIIVKSRVHNVGVFSFDVLLFFISHRFDSLILLIANEIINVNAEIVNNQGIVRGRIPFVEITLQ